METVALIALGFIATLVAAAMLAFILVPLINIYDRICSRRKING